MAIGGGPLVLAPQRISQVHVVECHFTEGPLVRICTVWVHFIFTAVTIRMDYGSNGICI